MSQQEKIYLGLYIKIGCADALSIRTGAVNDHKLHLVPKMQYLFNKVFQENTALWPLVSADNHRR